MTIRRPCLNCGALTTNTTRCPDCQKHHDRLYDADYRRAAQIIRDTATTCHICGEGARPDDPFTADHIRPRDRTSPLAAAHRSCNTRKSNRLNWRDTR
jgi:5-methylcytosine-specific restriction endonuclease McrA